jgi:hypothetical protein
VNTIINNYCCDKQLERKPETLLLMSSDQNQTKTRLLFLAIEFQLLVQAVGGERDPYSVVPADK